MRKAVVVLAAVTSVSTSLPAAAQQDAFSLRGLVVTASPTPRSVESVASHVTILEGEELRLRGVASLGEVLRDVAGVDVVRSGSFGALTSVFLRGGESDYTLVLVDGVQVNQPGGGFDFAALSLDNVERVEVVRGPSSALYGSDAVAGVIHIVTRDARGPTRARASVETGSYGEPRGHLVDGLRWSADVEGGTGSAGYSVSLSRDATDGLLGFNNRHESTVLVGNARLLPEAQTRIDLMLRLSDRRYHFPTDGSGAVSDVNAFNYTDAATAHVRLARRIGDRLEVEARLGLHETDGGLDDAQDGPADTLGFFESSSLEHFRRASGEIRANLRLRSGLVVTGGGELEDEGQRTFSESRSEFGPSTGRSDSERLNRAVFLHATAGGPEVGLNVGGRLEDNERFGSVGTWQVGLSALVPGSGGARVRASAGSAIKEPTFYENYATGFARGNPDLEPERSGAWEVGLERQLLADAATVRLTYFSQRFRDLIQYTFTPPAPTEPNFFNVAEATARGLEVDAQLRAGPLSAGVAWTWLDTEVTEEGFDEGPGATFVSGQRLLRRPTHTLALRASARLGSRGRAFTSVSVVGNRADRDFSSFPAAPVELRPYTLWNAGGEWVLWPAREGRPEATLSLRAENLLGRAYQESFGFRAPGRQLYVGFSVSFGGPDGGS